MLGKRWKKGKSYHKYCYTVKDIADITGRAIGTLRNDMSKKELIMDDLASVVKYISNYKSLTERQEN